MGLLDRLYKAWQANGPQSVVTSSGGDPTITVYKGESWDYAKLVAQYEADLAASRQDQLGIDASANTFTYTSQQVRAATEDALASVVPSHVTALLGGDFQPMQLNQQGALRVSISEDNVGATFSGTVTFDNTSVGVNNYGGTVIPLGAGTYDWGDVRALRNLSPDDVRRLAEAYRAEQARAEPVPVPAGGRAIDLSEA